MTLPSTGNDLEEDTEKARGGERKNREKLGRIRRRKSFDMGRGGK